MKDLHDLFLALKQMQTQNLIGKDTQIGSTILNLLKRLSELDMVYSRLSQYDRKITCSET